MCWGPAGAAPEKVRGPIMTMMIVSCAQNGFALPLA
jgi:hypothetical protein